MNEERKASEEPEAAARQTDAGPETNPEAGSNVGPEKIRRDAAEAGHHLFAFLRGMFSIGVSSVRSARRTVEKLDDLTTPLPMDAPGADAPPPVEHEQGRSADRNEDPASSAAREKRENRGTLLVLLAFTCSIVAGIGFVVTYWTGGSNEWLGGNLALSLGGLGAALVLWAHWLTEHKQATEPREVLPSPQKERDEVLKDWCAGKRDVKRRRLLQWMGSAAAAVLGAGVISLLRSLGSNPNKTLYSGIWKKDQRLMTDAGKPIVTDSLEIGSAVTVYPEDSLGSERSQTMLVRVDPGLLRLPEERADWAPLGYLAYSRICTHAGCPVGLYESKQALLLCPCHQSSFDVLRAALPTGGPAARPLPQLPLYVHSDGTLRAAADFSNPPGPGFWGMP